MHLNSHLAKRLSILLIAIVISVAGYSQSHLVPDTVISRVVDELIVCDGVKQENGKLKKTVKLYEHTDSLFKVEQKAYIGKIQQYKADSVSFIKTVESKDKAIRNSKKDGRKKAVIGGLIGAGIVIIINWLASLSD